MEKEAVKYRKIAILGAGAVGSYALWGLSSKEDIECCLVAQGDRKRRLERDGLMINDKDYFPKVRTPEEARGADLLIVSLKYGALPEALPDIRTVADDHTAVMSLMNGVDSEEIIGQIIPEDQIIYSLIKVASARKGREVRFDPEMTIGIIYGEKDRSRSGERMKALEELFSDTGLHFRETDQIECEIWGKFLLNVGDNLPQAMVGCGIGAYQDSEHVKALRLKLRQEVIKIAEAKGIDLSKNDPTSFRGSRVTPGARYSTLQDLDAGRHTEIDMFSGAVVRMGEELGIPTPYNEFTWHMIHALEEKNDGKFEY